MLFASGLDVASDQEIQVAGGIDDGNGMNQAAFGGDGDPFPHLRAGTLATLTGHTHSGEVRGTAEYRAQQTAGFVRLTATGGAPINVKVTLLRSLTAEFPPAFALVFALPEGEMLQMTSFTVQEVFEASDPVESLRVKDAEGWHQISVEQDGNRTVGSDHGNP